ncbi:MAG: Bifunctional ligase/repressor BirA [Chlamydiales bacterium]|nr:Bifunctional ligase/repressor BirA [Chlamydiales bacterium]
MGAMEMIHHHFDTLVSTNDWGKEHLASQPRDRFMLVTADEQTRGRGQYGRKWISPKGQNLYASFCFFIDEHQQDPLSLTHVLAISLAHVLEKRGVICQIKWPNDLLVDRKKIAGILCETEHLPPHFGVVIGLGMNINMSQEELAHIPQPATSIRQETGEKCVIGEVLQEIQAVFAKDLAHFLKKGFTPFLPVFRQLILPGLRNQHIL